MSALLDIPEDIFETLLEELLLQKELKSIKSLASCCKALLPLCRKHIFLSIKLCPPNFPLSELACFFESNPDVSAFVKHLELGTVVDILRPNLLRVVRSFRHIQTFMLSGYSGIQLDNWERIPEETKDAVMHVLSLPTLSNLTIRKLLNFPASVFITCFKIVTLVLDSTSLTNSNSNRNHDHKNIPSVRSFTTGSMYSLFLHNTNILIGSDSESSSRFIDFTNLQHLTINSNIQESDLIAATKMMTIGHRSIKSFALHYGGGLTHKGVAAAIRDSGVSNLECFVASFFMFLEEKPLTIICDELLKMSLDNHSNNLIDIQITVKVVIAESECEKFQEWSRLDSILAGEGFKRLSSASITVLINESQLAEGARKKMEMLTFPNLKSRSDNSILFTYKVVVGESVW